MLKQQSRGIAVWLGLSVLLMAMVAVEIAGFTLAGWHTISWTAQHNPLVFWLIFAGGIIFELFWIDHIFLSGAIAK